MKTERRHELQKNELADWLTRFIEKCKPYGRAIAATSVLLVVIAVGYVLLSRYWASQATAAWNRFFVAQDEYLQSGDMQALRTVVAQYQGTEVGLYARHFLGDALLEQGIGELFRDREAARKSLQEAQDLFAAVVQRASGSLREQALLGLGRAYESQNNLTQAKVEYEKLANSGGGGPYVEEAKRRLDALNQPYTQDFYTWFSTQNPHPQVFDPHTGLPPSTPGFDFNNLPTGPSSMFSNDSFLDPIAPPAATGAGLPDSDAGAPTGSATGEPAGTATTPAADTEPAAAPAPATTGDAPSGDSPATTPAPPASDNAAPPSADPSPAAPAPASP